MVRAYYFDMSTNELIQVTNKFLKQNSKYAKTKRTAKKGGPYTRTDKDKRRDEVYRLHFDYGYSARKIAELMKVNRNTVNGDVDYWYSKMPKNVNDMDPTNATMIYLETMTIQITRLREQLDKVKNNSERMPIERLIFDINSKIIYTYEKLSSSIIRTHGISTKWYNSTMKKYGKSNRVITYFDTISVSKKAHERINRIINEDKS